LARVLRVFPRRGGVTSWDSTRWCWSKRKKLGGQLSSVHNAVENYLGVRAANGSELRDLFAEQTKDCDFDLWTNVEIDSVDLKAKRITLRSGEELQSIAILIATGLRRRRLGIPGETEFTGRGIIESGARDSRAGRGQRCLRDSVVAMPRPRTL
jgi:thioredoxin reductase (NADPH)